MGVYLSQCKQWPAHRRLLQRNRPPFVTIAQPPRWAFLPGGILRRDSLAGNYLPSPLPSFSVHPTFSPSSLRSGPRLTESIRFRFWGEEIDVSV